MKVYIKNAYKIYGKVKCPDCNGIDTRRYQARGYVYCFTCNKEIPYPEEEINNDGVQSTAGGKRE